MYWIIEENMFKEPFYDKLFPFLDRMNIPYETNRVIPFSGEFLKEPQPTQDKVIVIGSYSMTEEAIRRKYNPGAFTNENYDYRVWSKKWKHYVLNDPAHICKFSEVPEQPKPFFIRPCEDTKEFAGTVMDWHDFHIWQQNVLALKDTYTTLHGDTAVLIAKPKKIEEEYRVIVVGGKPITASLYKSGTLVTYQNRDDDFSLMNFCQYIASLWVPSQAFALDIALYEGSYWVLEMGNMNAAGLYECDIQKIVMALEEMYA